MKFATQLLVATSMLASKTSAWWNNGHMLTAKVAYDHLRINNPDVLKKAEDILKPLQYMNKHEDKHSFVECATFADDLKNRGMSDQSPWHFIDQPFLDGVFPTVFPEQFNVTWSVEYMTKNLMGPRDGVDDAVSWNLTDAFNLRLLIHYIGDIHQPLHTVSRFAKEFPNGDRGGNDFKLIEKENVTELHALWDSTVYEWDDDFSQPLNDSMWNKMTNISSNLRSEHPVDEPKMATDLKKAEKDWAAEGYKLATEFVYKIEENTLPSDEYVKKG